VQHLTNTGHQPGTIVVTAASLARYAEFWLSVEALNVPHGTRLIASRGADIPHQLNEGIRRMTGEWVFILGDDHTFQPNILLEMLAKNKDVLIPVVPRRDAPFCPVLLHGPISNRMVRYSWNELPIRGLYQLPITDIAGQAGCLVRKSILDLLGDPWFECGQVEKGRLQEDIWFIQRLHNLGIPIYVDCDQVMPHIANITITPQRHNGRWYPGHITKQGPVLWDEPEGIGWGSNITQVA
jgi:Glycosyl transferase family 2